MHEASEQSSYVHGNVLAPVRADALDPTERSCSICLQPFGSEVPCQLPCGHVFGEVCIGSWIQLDNSCPLCRKLVFSFGNHDSPAPEAQDPLNDQISIAFSSVLTPQDDIWLSEEVWNNSTYRCPRTVSNTDIDALVVDFFSSEHSYSSPDSQPQSALGRFLRGDDHGSSQYSGDGGLGYAMMPHRRRPAPSTTTCTRPVDIDLDIVGLGSQFAELDYRHIEWMDEYLNESSLDGSSLLSKTIT